jgi:DNA-binding NarL/FixJ family response regulator
MKANKLRMKRKLRDQTYQIANVLGRLTDYLVTVESHANPTTPPQTQAQTVAREPLTPSTCSPQSGLSPDFIARYSLTNRHVQVTEQLLRGKSDKEIASLLNIGITTVQTHLKHIYRKTETRGRYALMVLVGLNK